MSPSPPLSLSSSPSSSSDKKVKGVSNCAFIFKYCRMCAVQLKQGVFIFGDEGQRLQLPEKIRKTLAILVLEEDTLPKKICTTCCSSLEDYSQYKDAVLDAQDKLAAIAKSLEARSHYELYASKEPRSQCQEGSSPTRLALLPPPTTTSGVVVEPSILQQALSSTSATVFVEEEEESPAPGPDPGFDADDDMTGPGSPLAIKDVSDDKAKDPVSSHPSTQVGVISSPPPSPVDEGDKSVTPSAPTTTTSTTQGSPGRWKCPICDKPYLSKRGLELHSVLHNPDARFECRLCDKYFNQKASLQHHMTSTHPDPLGKGRSFACDSCPKTFLTQKMRNRHRRFHTEPRVDSPCTVCGKVYKSALHLQDHMKGHRSKLNFPCLFPECGKRFLNQSKLSTHTNSHTGQRTFKCKDCPYAARTPGPFYKHLKTHKKEKEKADAKETSPNPGGGEGVEKEEEEESVNLTLNFSVLEDLSNKSPSKVQIAGVSSSGRVPLPASSGSSLVSQSHSAPIPHGHSQQHGHSHLMEYSESQNQGQISHAHTSSHPQNPQLINYHHSPQGNSSHSQSQSWSSKQSSYPSTSTTTTTLELVDCSGITHAFPCDQLPPPPSYHHQHNQLQSPSSYGVNYSSSHRTPITTTAILHTSPISSAHSASNSMSGNVAFISTTSPSTGGGGGNNEPMELSYKLHLENVQAQDVPMELTKVVFVQRDPLELCVRDQQGQSQGQSSGGGQGHDGFNPLMDLSSARGVNLNGDGLHLNTGPLNLNLNNNSINWGSGYHCKDLAERELCFNDLSGAFRQPIDLIARGPDDPHGHHGDGDDLSTSEGNLVDLSLRSGSCFGVQDASTSTFLRELIDLSARSETFHGNNGELNLTNKQQQHGSNSSSQHNNSHFHHHHHRGGGGGGSQQGQGSSLTSVIYQDAMFSL